MNAHWQLTGLKLTVLAKDRDDERAILERGFYGRMAELFDGQTVATGPKGIKAGSKIDAAMLDELPKSQWQQLAVKADDVQKLIEAQVADFESAPLPHCRHGLTTKLINCRAVMNCCRA